MNLILSKRAAAALLLAAFLAGCARAPGPAGHKAGDGSVLGTGPGRTAPPPLVHPLVLKNVKGAKVTNEKYSVRGNKDYDVLGKHYVVWQDVKSYEEEGVASWYGPGFNGQKTSNGEHYEMNGYSAAHKNLPLPSFLKVTNLENGKAVIVRVNDRGPFHDDRILDLSKGAAAAVGVIGPGTARVRVQLIKTSPDGGKQTTASQMNGFKPYIQIFTTMDYNKAQSIRDDAAAKTGRTVFIEESGNAYRIKAGPLKQEDTAAALELIKKSGYPEAFFTSD